MILGFVTGLTAEARIAHRFGGLVRAGGGMPDGAERAARALKEAGAQALISFGLAGGLDPVLRPGDVIMPAEVIEAGVVYAADQPLSARFGGPTLHRLLAGDGVVATATAKRAAAQASGAQAVDLESGAVARVAHAFGLPFAVIRAICDPAQRDLPPAALIALDRAGAIGLIQIIGSVIRYPGQLPTLISLAGDAASARRALLAVADGFTATPANPADNGSVAPAP